MTEPVTVSITRHVDPSQEDEMRAWLRAGFELAERFDGFLGSGWVRPAPESDEWHVLYRFSSQEALEAWELSPKRRWWLDSAQGLVDESSREHRTGIEGWFDEPSSVDVEDLRSPSAVPPPRWKQMCAIFLVFLPRSVAANYAVKDVLADVWLPVRVLVTVAVMTPIMTYFALPWITKLLHGWLTSTRD